jgi:ATP synthase protein I
MPSDHKAKKQDKTESAPRVPEKAKSVSSQFAVAMELPFVLVSAVVVGGLLGYFLDRWLHTKPVFMLIFGAIGFFAGVRDVLRRLPGNDNGAKGS